MKKYRVANVEAYHLAQHALADLKSAICQLLVGSEGDVQLTNSQIGRLLGIYQGHIGHEGHIPRTLLGIMEAEGLVEQDTESKKWHLRRQIDSDDTSV